MDSSRDALTNNVNALTNVLDTIRSMVHNNDLISLQQPHAIPNNKAIVKIPHPPPSRHDQLLSSTPSLPLPPSQQTSRSSLPMWSELGTKTSRKHPIRPTSLARGKNYLKFKRLYVNPRNGRTSVSLAMLRFGKGKRKRPTPKKSYKRKRPVARRSTASATKQLHSRNQVPETNGATTDAPTMRIDFGHSNYPSERIAAFFSPECGILSPRTLELVRNTVKMANKRKRLRRYRDKYASVTKAKKDNQVPPKLNSYEKRAVLNSIVEAEKFIWASEPGQVLSMEEVIANPLLTNEEDENNCRIPIPTVF